MDLGLLLNQDALFKYFQADVYTIRCRIADTLRKYDTDGGCNAMSLWEL